VADRAVDAPRERSAEQQAEDIAYAASIRFIEALDSIGLTVTTAKVVTPEGRAPGVRVGTFSSPDLDALSGLIEAEAARRATTRALDRGEAVPAP
jgi:hypothetical protein